MSSLKEDYNITLTESAVCKINQLIAQENNKLSLLRISILGGGCSGFQYNFSIDNLKSQDDFDDDEIEDDDFDDDEMYDDDENDEVTGVKGSNVDIKICDKSGKPILLIDKQSNEILKGSVIDYIEDLNGSGFVVNNPIAKSKCGCGNSFSI